MNIKLSQLIIFSVIFLFGCASVTSPTGGPKDEAPPILILSDPPNGSLNFSSRTISLSFNEFIDLKNHLEQILVTPRLSEDFEVIVKRRTAILKLNEDLQPNTTYTFNFRDAIVDITESNPAVNLKLAFSTGAYIDSAYIEGKVVNLKKQKPEKSVLVGAYFAEDTLSLLNQAPDYMTISNEDGSFRMDNLKPGNYLLYALRDKNKNSMLDFKTESYGFLRDTLSLDTAITGLVVPLTYNDQRPLALQSARPTGKYFVVKYNKYVEDYSIDFVSERDSIHSKMDEDHQSIKFYNSIQRDSIQLLLTVTDTLLRSHLDTINLKFVESPRSFDEYSVKFTSKPQPKTTRSIKASLSFSKPSALLNKDSLYLLLDSIALYTFKEEDLLWNSRHTLLTLQKSLDTLITDSTNLSLLKLRAGKNAFQSVEKDSSNQINGSLTFLEQEKTGVLEVQVQTDYSSYIIQLLSPTYEVLDEKRNTDSFSFSYLKPGKYMLRALIDINSDGVWNPGNIFDQTEPEPILMYQTSTGEEELTLKANWVLGPNVFTF